MIPSKLELCEKNQERVVGNEKSGPVFGSNGYDLFIGDRCNEEDSCYINNDGTRGYECHPIWKKSLFVNTDSCEEMNCFCVIDYEVFMLKK